jgi:hypothetical protein
MLIRNNEQLALYIKQHPTNLELVLEPEIVNLPDLPHTLLHLDVRGDGLDCLPGLPRKLMSLAVGNCPRLTELSELPRGLNSLAVVSCPGISWLPRLEDGLLHLELRDCPVARLPEMPDTLQSLRLTNCRRLNFIPSLPESLTVLKIVDTPLVRGVFKVGKLLIEIE